MGSPSHKESIVYGQLHTRSRSCRLFTWDSFLNSSFIYVLDNLLPSGSPLATSLIYDNQSRTLTCTFTCGPANVTWRKDGTVITPNDTYQQTMRRVHIPMDTYQTVLTIDPALDQSDIVGLYVCTVENAMPRGSSSVTLVVAGNGELISHIHHFIALG